MTLDGIVGGIGPICILAPLAILGRMALFGGSSIGPSPMRPLLEYALSRLGGCCSLSLVGSGFLVVLLNKELLDILKVLEQREATPGLSCVSGCTGSSTQLGGVTR
jgi:hypothetical protein